MTKRINCFIPYMRQGITTLANHDEVKGKRMTIPVELTVTASNIKDNTDIEGDVVKEIALYGPGDLLGINKNVISRMAPSPDVDNFESSLTPFIEFSAPDFLWRFSSRQTADKNNWIPWLTLIILKTEAGQEEGEFVKVRNSNKELPPQIQLKPNAILPDLKESWRWAHVHKLDIDGSSAEQILDSIKKAPEKAVCRLLSPRRLKPQTRYHAFLIPAFKIGAEAAMGITNGVEDRTLLTWDRPSDGAGKILPYYYDWEFGTGIKGDFEYLVRKLKPRELENIGTRSIDCSNPGYGLKVEEEEGLELQMEAALKSLDTEYQQWGMASINGWRLDMMSVIHESDKQKKVDEFKAEPKKNKHTLLIVHVASSESKVWTIAMFNNEGIFINKKLVDDVNNELAKELSKEVRNKERIFKRAISYLDPALVEGDDSLSKNKENELAALLNKREENDDDETKTKLRVTPPVYGEWYASREGEALKAGTQSRNQWLEELNLDFRHRAAAGLGAQFVKENQETLMKAAWKQFSKIKKVNQELNLGRFGREVSLCMYKRIKKMEPTNSFKITLPVLDKISPDSADPIKSSKTIGSVLRNSTVTNNLIRIKAMKYLSKRGISKKRGISTAKPAFASIKASQLVSSAFRIQGMKNTLYKDKIKDKFYKTEAKPIGDIISSSSLEVVREALNPITTIESRIKNRFFHFRSIEEVETAQDKTEDKLRSVKWYPEFHRPMYRFLRELSQEYILPGLENVPQNTVGLLQTNRRFIEAFMVGLNHEMASELRWREFPTDMRGSYFRSFWDTSIYSVDEEEKEKFRDTIIGKKLLDQIRMNYGDNLKDCGDNLTKCFQKMEELYTKPGSDETEKEIADAYEAAIEKWLLTRDEDKDIDKLANWKKSNRLGDNPVQGKLNNQDENHDQIVLLIRGELLQKFSNTLIYLVKKKDDKPDLSNPDSRIFPVFEGALPPDIVFIGLPIKKKDADDYFIIFEERMTELRFGLDEPSEGPEGTDENDFSWGHFKDLSHEGYLDGIQPEIFKQKWNNAAYISKVMMQKQVRAAIELKTLLPG